VTRRHLTTALKVPAAVFLLIAAACSTTTHKRELIDLIPYLDATLINYHSQQFNLSDQYPLDTQMAAGQFGSHAAVISPVEIPIGKGGYELVDIENAKVYLKLELTPGNHDGATLTTLYVGNSLDIYNDPTAVKVERKMFLPAIYELSTEDPKLRQIFALDDVVFGMRFVIEPTRLDSHDIFIEGHIEQFEAEISGVQGIF
jgi:hypothetical protein